MSMCTGHWNIAFYIEELSSEKTSTIALANIRHVFEQVYTQPDQKLCMSIWLHLHLSTIELYQYDYLLISVLEWSLTYACRTYDGTGSLCLRVSLEGLDNSCTLDIAHCLSHLPSSTYTTLKFFGLDGPHCSGSILPIQELVEQWKCVDTALMHPMYANIHECTIDYFKNIEMPEELRYTCTTDLFHELLLRFTSRVTLESRFCTKGPGQNLCTYHQ